MGLLSSLGLKDDQHDLADVAKADSLRAQFGKDLKSAVVLATRLRDLEAKKKLAAELKNADAELRQASTLRNPGERAQAMQAALDKVNASAAKAKEVQQAEVRPGTLESNGQADKPTASADKPSVQGTGKKPGESGRSQPADDKPTAKASEGQVDKDKDGQTQTRRTVKTSAKDGATTVQVDTDTTTNKPDRSFTSHKTDKQTVGSKSIDDSTTIESQTLDTDGVKLENESSEQVIDATGKHARKEKSSFKSGRGGESSSDDVEVDAADGSRVMATSSDDSIRSKDGGLTIKKRSHTQIVDAKGNSVTMDASKESYFDKDGKAVGTMTSMGVQARTAEEAAAEKAQLEQAVKAKQGQVAAARNKAVGRGNRLSTLFRANQLTAAGQKINAGLAELKSGDAVATKISTSVDGFHCEVSGNEAIEHYDAAAQLFAEGMAMSGEGVRPPPPPDVPETGGV